ncbi:MAG TPA: hypothetical protein VLF43_02280 [Candidatus Saccharimonadales bacterium]|nr:hypothetical protein [Candidatus Saccharimonadales bacterium]
MAETPPPPPNPDEIARQLGELNTRAELSNRLLHGIYTQFGGGRQQTGGALPPIDTSELGAVNAASLVSGDGAERKLVIGAEQEAAANHSAAHPIPKTRRPIPTGPVTAFVKSRLKQTGDAGRYAHAKLSTAQAVRSQKVHEMYEAKPRMRRIAYRLGDVAAAGAIVYAAHKGWDFTHPGS